MYLVIVYQGGLANVFELSWPSRDSSSPKRKRLLQGTFAQCEWFMRGAQYGGAIVEAMACNMAGDIANQPWTYDLENQPFSDQFGCAWMKITLASPAKPC